MTNLQDALTNALSTCKHQGVVCVDGRGDELIVSAKADGVLKAGNLVGVISTEGATLGDIDGIVDGGFETFMGILLPKYNVDCDTAVDDGDPVEIVIPKQGRHYNVSIKAPAATTVVSGTPFIFSTTEASLDKSTDVLVLAVARATRGINTASTFGEMIWGPN